MENTRPMKKPKWIRRKLPSGPEYEAIRSMLRDGKLHTVCQEAQCPNIWECFSCGTATFLILGSRCTRNCRFCAVEQGPLGPPDPEEPGRVAEAAEKMGLQYIVVTSVTRDDLPDGGATQFAESIREIRKRIPDARVEVLIPDFQGDPEALKIALNAGPDVLNHNMETVSRLYGTVRPQADYRRSLDLLQRSLELAPAIPTKSGIMLGLGEQKDEIREVLSDLRTAGCRMLTLGQYLQPSRDHLPVERYVEPEEFDQWREETLNMGFTEVSSGPLVRSSYHAQDLFRLPED
ncbi:Lipoyl synthase (EC [Olavius algarvensis associated proteobacterium Delta 3]|nr:Lipoyl synthase (EC [Olavius algarvensis associated proteobacterium Delta 3]